MLSQKARYAIRAMQHLSDHYGQWLVPLADIAAAQNIPAKFLTVILSEFSRLGLVESQRGRDGGYRLALPPVDISYGDLMRVTRGSLALVPLRQPIRPRNLQELPGRGRMPNAGPDAAGSRPHRRTARRNQAVGPDRY